METIYDTIHRPPPESRSALLEVSVGCSYGKCTFCRLSNGEIPLQLVSTGTLTANLEEMALRGEPSSRMFLTGENVLAFRTQYLLDVFALVRSYLPSIQEFAMYARADDILRKTDEQLTHLRANGLHTLYVGVESGNAQVLDRCKKGETPELILQQLQRLDRLGIQYGLSSILGLGGVELWQQHAQDTAALYNQTHPRSIRVMTLTSMPGTPLEQEIRDGLFRPLSPKQILQEELLLLRELRLTGPVRFVGNHVSNDIPMVGYIPADLAQMIQKLEDALEKIPDNEKKNLKTW